MSQIPRNRFGFQGPRTVTATATRTTRIPGTNATRTESRTAVTEVTPCPAASAPQAEGPQRSIPRPSGLQAPRAISRRAQPDQPPSQISRPSQGISGPPQVQPAPSQPASRLRPPSQGIPQIRISRPSGIPQTNAQSIPQKSVSRPSGIPQTTAQGTIPRQIAAPSGIPGVRRPATLPQKTVESTPQPQLRKQTLAVPLEGTPDRKSPSPGTFAPKTERVLPVQSNISKPSKPYGIGVNVPKSLLTDPKMFHRSDRVTPEDRKRPPSRERQQAPGSLEDQVNQSLYRKSSDKQKKKVSAKGKRVTTAEPEVVETPAGRQPVLQKGVFERRMERGAEGEKLVKNLALTEFDESLGETGMVEVAVQQLDPQLPMKEGKEVIGVTSTVTVTPSYTTISREVLRTITEPLDHGITMKPADVAQLVREEKEDVENTLKMIPPDLNLSPGKFEVKQRLQQLRLNSESMALLEESIMQPEVTADEAQSEPTPETMANMMHTVENGISPRAAPDQVFHSLFSEPANEQYIKMSSVSPGPLQDVVIPTEDVPTAVHHESVSENMDKLADKFSRIAEPQQVPYVDIFTRVMDEMKKSPEKGKNKPRSFQPISDEKSLWVNAKLEHLVNVIGAEPADVLGALDIEELSKSGDLEQEMINGVEFYVDTDPVQYINRIQLRGTQLPSYFPGYMVAVPDFPGIVQIARSPDEVFATAWKSVQPKYFADDSLSAVSF
ncbi:uncharacterized protein [Leptinotarsa decemlineata]|uniref:uncharacterized protein n=1 Tax=Leptinotarsa decemlineata TaxID=7539 RepID=UPI003D30BFB1